MRSVLVASLFALIPSQAAPDEAYFDAVIELRLRQRPATAAPRLSELLAELEPASFRFRRTELELARAELLLGRFESVARRLDSLRNRPPGESGPLPGVEALSSELEALTYVEPAPVAPALPPEMPSNPEPLPEPEPDPEPARSAPHPSPWPAPPALRSTARIDAPELATREQQLDARADEWRAALPGDSIGALLGRSASSKLTDDKREVYRLATYSFEHATRDDTRAVRNDWDLQFGNGTNRFHVDMTGGDRSTCEDLGPDPHSLVSHLVFEAGADEALARLGHTYRIHTLDSNTDARFALQVLELREAEWVIFRWRRMD